MNVSAGGRKDDNEEVANWQGSEDAEAYNAKSNRGPAGLRWLPDRIEVKSENR